MVWLLGQASVNMAVVTGLAPVIGVPLPFISYGGSALLMSLCAIGVVLSLARAQMDPGMQPKKMLRFGPAAFANSVRRARAARAVSTAASRSAARPGAKSGTKPGAKGAGNGSGNPARNVAYKSSAKVPASKNSAGKIPTIKNSASKNRTKA
jgi:cell division protein FtsW